MNAEVRAVVKQHIGLDVWAQFTARAQRLVKDVVDAESRMSAVQWAWGDLSLEVLPMNDPNMPRTGRAGGSIVDVVLGAIIDECGLPWSVHTLKNIRQVADAWPKAKRKQCGWQAHKALAFHPDRFDLLKDDTSIGEALALAGRKPRGKGRQKGITAITCADAAKSWAKSCHARMGTDEPSEDLILAASDAWMEATRVVDELGILEPLLEEFEQTRTSAELSLAS